MIIHFKKNTLSRTACKKLDMSIPVNINWNKVNCTECLMIKSFAKKKRHEK